VTTAQPNTEIDCALKSMASNSAPAPKPETLTDLALKIKTAHEQLVSTSRGIVDRAIDIGKDLLKARAAGGWGKWGKWLKGNCAMQERNASRYMYLADHEATLKTELLKINSDIVSELTLAGAKRLIDDARIAAGQLTRDPPTPKKKPKAGRGAEQLRWNACHQSFCGAQREGLGRGM
jgi:hypothetical protein